MMDSLENSQRFESKQEEHPGFREILHTFKKISNPSTSEQVNDSGFESRELGFGKESSFSMHSGLNYSQSTINLTKGEESHLEERYQNCNVFNTYCSVRKKLGNERVVAKGHGVVEKIGKSGVTVESGSDITFLKSDYLNNSRVEGSRERR